MPELVEKLDKLQKGQQSRTAEPDAPVSPFGLRVAVPASRCAPWSGACALRPPPLLRLAVSAAGGARLHSLRQNFTANRAIGLWPPTQFAAKFPCMCCQRRHMSAAGNGFLTFSDNLGAFLPRGGKAHFYWLRAFFCSMYASMIARSQKGSVWPPRSSVVSCPLPITARMSPGRAWSSA